MHLERSNLRADLGRCGAVVERETQVALKTAVSKIDDVIGVVVGEAVAHARNPHPARPSHNAIALVYVNCVVGAKPRSHRIRKRLNYMFDLGCVVLRIGDDRRNVAINLSTCRKASGHVMVTFELFGLGAILSANRVGQLVPTKQPVGAAKHWSRSGRRRPRRPLACAGGSSRCWTGQSRADTETADPGALEGAPRHHAAGAGEDRQD